MCGLPPAVAPRQGITPRFHLAAVETQLEPDVTGSSAYELLGLTGLLPPHCVRSPSRLPPSTKTGRLALNKARRRKSFCSSAEGTSRSVSAAPRINPSLKKTQRGAESARSCSPSVKTVVQVDDAVPSCKLSARAPLLVHRAADEAMIRLKPTAAQFGFGCFFSSSSSFMSGGSCYISRPVDGGKTGLFFFSFFLGDIRCVTKHSPLTHSPPLPLGNSSYPMTRHPHRLLEVRALTRVSSGPMRGHRAGGMLTAPEVLGTRPSFA